MNICNGQKNDCVAKGKAKCSKDKKCFGIMYNAASWGPHFKGVKVCASRRMAKKGDWFTYLKQGKLFINLLSVFVSAFLPLHRDTPLRIR